VRSIKKKGVKKLLKTGVFGDLFFAYEKWAGDYFK